MNSVYIAMSIDGYIASKNHSISWLEPFNELIASNSTGYFASAYENYYKNIDNVVMGYTTYEVITGFGIDYPYLDKKNYIITHRDIVSTENNIEFITLEMFQDLALAQKNWIVGGGKIISELLQVGLIDEIIITIMPVVLGNGIPLFRSGFELVQNFKLIKHQVDHGIVELTYLKITKS